MSYTLEVVYEVLEEEHSAKCSVIVKNASATDDGSLLLWHLHLC